MKNVQTERKMWIRVAALALAILLVLGVIISSLSALADEAAPPERDQYSLDMEILLDSQAVRVRQSVDYTNRTGDRLDNVMFLVYSNILRRQTTVPVEAEDFNDAFPEGYAPGGVDFISVKADGEPVIWGVQGDSELFLRVKKPLEPGEKTRFEFEFYLLLPVYSGAMGAGDMTWRLTGFYPVAAAWDEVLGEFVLSGYTSTIEPMCADAADYKARFALPEGWAVAAPGLVEAKDDGTGMVEYSVQAEGIRELSLVLSRKETEAAGYTGLGTRVRALGNTPSAARRMLDVALPVMNWLEETFGRYPWPGATLVETEYLYGGLSCPGVMQVSSFLTALSQRQALEERVISLCVHQYFSDIVLSSRERAPWLSEALSSYVALMYHQSREGYGKYLARLRAQVRASLSLTIPGGVTVDSESTRFTSRMEFEVVVVDRGTAVLHELRSAMGEDVFLEALQRYVKDNWLRRATATEFLAAMNEVSGRRWDEYLYGQMHHITDYTADELI